MNDTQFGIFFFGRDDLDALLYGRGLTCAQTSLSLPPFLLPPPLSLLDYIVLENLTAKYRFPCILDLKIGTRQHGDDAPEDKKIRHSMTCADSTSLSLGVRLCGVQVSVCGGCAHRCRLWQCYAHLFPSPCALDVQCYNKRICVS